MGVLDLGPSQIAYLGKLVRDGPSLPVEFARVSMDKRLTLVLYPRAGRIQVLWDDSRTEDLDEAIEDLKDRENTLTVENIGFVDVTSGQRRCQTVPDAVDEIRHWARQKGVNAVIWTDLPGNFEKKTHTDFSEENVLAYLENLPEEAKRMAEVYVRRAPRQISTRMRRAIEQRFGWVD